MSQRDGTVRDRWNLARRTAFLPTARLFHDLPPGILEAAAACFMPRWVQTGEFIFIAGQPAASVSLLAEGRVKVVQETEEGREVILRLIQPGELFGGAGGWGESTYPATAIALQDSVVLQLPAADFARMVACHPPFAAAVIRDLGARLREAEARIRELQTERAERRIARTLLRLANKTGVRTANGVELNLSLSRQDLAELAGTNLSTASRTLSAWDRAGLIRAQRGRIVILSPHRLVALAEDLDGPSG